jgi:hypothetical protein
MYINRKDALEILKKLSREPYYQHYGEDYYVGVAEATGEIYSMLPADVVPIIHAEWVKKDGLYCCSHCDSVCPYDVQADVIEYWECFYCPKCGAIMNK